MLITGPLKELLDDIRDRLSQYGEKHHDLLTRIDEVAQTQSFASLPSHSQFTPQDHEMDSQFTPGNQLQANVEESLSEVPEEPSEFEQQQNSWNLEFYYLDFDSKDRNYHLVRTREGSTGQYMKEIADLILSFTQSHIKDVKVQDVTSKVSAEPRILKPLVVPLVEENTYALVFETPDFRKVNDKYEVSDRFMVFISKGFLPETLCQIVKFIARKEHDNRFQLGSPEYALESDKVRLQDRTELLNNIHSYLAETQINKLSLKKVLLRQEKECQWYFRMLPTYNIAVRTENQLLRPILVISLLLFYVTRQIKVTFLARKEHRHVISEAVMGLKRGLAPLQFPYPTIFASISSKHDSFLDIPIPCIVGYWGQHCRRMRRQFHKEMVTEQDLNHVMIDISKKIMKGRRLTPSQSQVIVKINDYLLRGWQGKGSCISQTSESEYLITDRIHSYVFEELVEGCNRQDSQFKEESKLFHQTCLYQSFIKK